MLSVVALDRENDLVEQRGEDADGELGFAFGEVRQSRTDRLLSWAGRSSTRRVEREGIAGEGEDLSLGLNYLDSSQLVNLTLFEDFFKVHLIIY